MTNKTKPQAKHTPGPLTVGSRETIILEKGFPINAPAKPGIGSRLVTGYASQETDAKLWAAAPDLLETLNRIANNAAGRKWNGESKGPDFDAFDSIEREARAAIAKAEGR